jgi:hypothetical protein
LRTDLHFATTLVLLLGAGLAAIGPTPARGGGGNLAARVDGSFSDAAGEGTFEGTLTLSGFERRDDGLVAVGTLDGAFTDGAGKVLGEVEDRAVALAVDPSTLVASCESAKLTIPLGDLDGAGVASHLQPVEVEIGATAVPGHRLDAPLCDLAAAAGSGADTGALAAQLDRVLAALE